jgi:hypothetical protein
MITLLIILIGSYLLCIEIQKLPYKWYDWCLSGFLIYLVIITISKILNYLIQ